MTETNYQKSVNNLTGGMGPLKSAFWENTGTTAGNPWSLGAQPLYFNGQKYVTSYDVNASEGLLSGFGKRRFGRRFSKFGKGTRKFGFGCGGSCGCSSCGLYQGFGKNDCNCGCNGKKKKSRFGKRLSFGKGGGRRRSFGKRLSRFGRKRSRFGKLSRFGRKRFGNIDNFESWPFIECPKGKIVNPTSGKCIDSEGRLAKELKLVYKPTNEKTKTKARRSVKKERKTSDKKCIGITKSNTACKNKALVGEKYCNKHFEKEHIKLKMD